jgi:4-amino-4-deoxy-L-arabinose transferase-like glycosyltransferase
MESLSLNSKRWSTVTAQIEPANLFWTCLIGISLYIVFATIKLGADLANPEGVAGYALGIIATIAVWVWLNRYHRTLTEILNNFCSLLLRIPFRDWSLVWVCIALLLRVSWVSLFPAEQVSDGAIYWILTKRLVFEGRFYVAGTYAYWPPGFPLFLAPTVIVFGDRNWVPLLVNLGLCVATLYTITALARLIADERVARLSSFLLLVWPNFVFSAGLVAKELLLVVLMPLTLVLYISAARRTRKSSFVLLLLGGIVLGYSVLTQPSLMLFPCVLGLYEVLYKRSFLELVRRLCPVIAGMTLVISPWTLRNYRMLGEFVVVTNTAGWVLYVGNNTQATGGYVSVGEDLAGLDEVSANRIALERARQWITENPLRFILLSFKKQILFLGDDSGGAFLTLKQGLGIGGIRYLLLKGASNFYWISVALLLLLVAIANWRRSSRQEMALLLMSFLYFLFLHSIFESGSRHHLGSMGCLLVLASHIAKGSES